MNAPHQYFTHGEMLKVETTSLTRTVYWVLLASLEWSWHLCSLFLNERKEEDIHGDLGMEA